MPPALRVALYKDIRLKIIRDGQQFLEQELQRESEYERPIATYGKEPFPVQDLDGDGEAEIVVDLYTGGAHCCTYSLIYRYEPLQNSYTSTKHFWGNAGYRLQDFDQDGKPEFES